MVKLKKVVMFLLVMAFTLILIPKESAKAYSDFTGNAENFYDLHGADNMKFFPTATDDGKIYFCARGKTASSGSTTRFHTVGWQFCLKNTRTGAIGYVYYERDSWYIEQSGNSIISSDGYSYDLYYITLKRGFLDRLSSSWKSAFTAGEVELTVNACMTTVVNGEVKGSIDDYGKTTGNVYKTYEGIAGAASWSSTAKESLKTYFNKTIDGLFHTITIVKGTGINSTVGSGTYLYGSTPHLQCNLATGYQWNSGRGSKWTGNDGYSSTTQNPYYTVGDHDVTIHVNGSINQYTIRFYNGGTQSTKTYTVPYGGSVTLPAVSSCGFNIPEGYTYDSSKAWAVTRVSDSAVYCGSGGWVTGSPSSSSWTKYKEGFSFALDSYWINANANPHGDDTFNFSLQKLRKLTVIFHKNDGGADETCTETYLYGKTGQYFGMYLTGDAVNWARWNKSSEGYYLPGDTARGGGWSTDPNADTGKYALSNEVIDSWISKNGSEIDLYMIRPPKKVTVIFHKNDGSNTTYTETYTYGKSGQYFGMNRTGSDAYFASWTRSGYTGIAGWAESASAATKAYRINCPVSNSWIVEREPQEEMYAVWGNTINIIVNPNGGVWKGSTDVQQYTKEKEEILALPYPTRTGYTFLGWTWSGATGTNSRTSIVGFSQTQDTQTASNGVVSYIGSGRYTNYKWTVSSASAADAWNRLTAATYSITAGHTYRISGEIRVNDGSPTGVRIYHGGKANDYESQQACYYAGSGWQSFSFDRTFSSAGTGYFEFVSTNFKNKTGTLSFDLKNLKVLDLTTGTYMTIDQVCSPKNGATNISVTASWQGNDGIPYKVHHYLMNTSGTGYDFWKTQTGAGVAGSTLSLASIKQTPEGFTTPSRMVVDGQKVESTTIKGDGSTEIYIYYDRNKYTLSVNAGAGISNASIDGYSGNVVSIYYGAGVTIRAEVNTGYQWGSNSKWTGTYSSSGRIYSFTMPAQNVTMTAQAELIRYPITYHLDGGTVAGNPDTYTIEDSFTLKNPAKEGHNFVGWTGSNGVIPYTTVQIAQGTTGALEFYANWELQEYYLSVTGFLNGTDSEHLLDSLYDQERSQEIGTFDVWVKKPGGDWYQDANHVMGYSRLLPYGTQWKIENIKGKTYEEMFYTYDGVKMGQNGEKNGTLSGTLTGAEWVVPVFTSWHKLSIGGYCDKQSTSTITGYGTFDISISGKNAMGRDMKEVGSGYIGSGTDGNDVTAWEGYYPYGSQFVISDIKKDTTNISSGKFADISFEGLFEALGGAAGSLVTEDASYSGTLTMEKAYMLQFLSWYAFTVNGFCDEADSNSVNGYGTFDVLENGVKIAEDVSFWDTIYPYDTKVTVNDIRPVIGHTYKGIKSGNTEHIMTSHNTLVLEYITNTYILIFESNHENGTMDPIEIKWDQDVTLPKNVFTTTKPSTFMGWLDTEDAEKAADAYEWRFTDEEHLSVEKVQMLVTDHEFGFVDGATIPLFAIWDYAPDLDVVDRYISIEYANSGAMTEDEILRTAVATDREDGSIDPGIHDMNSLVLVNYNLEDYLNWSGEGTISETYRVIDRVGNVTEKMVRVHITDTTAYKVESEYQKARFINEKYIDLSLTEEEGGLAENSIWRTPEYYEVLSKTLSNKRINQEEVEIQLTLFKTTVTRPGSGEWLYEPKQSWRFSHEDVLTVKQYVRDHGPGNFYEEDALANFCVEFAHCRLK